MVDSHTGRTFAALLGEHVELIKKTEGRRREGRMLLARLGRKARAAAANPTQANLDKLRREAELVGDYLQRTAEPSDILRARTPEEEGADNGRAD